MSNLNGAGNGNAGGNNNGNGRSVIMGVPSNGFSSAPMAEALPQAAALHNMIPGLAVQALLQNKNRQLMGNASVEGSAPLALTNGLPPPPSQLSSALQSVPVEEAAQSAMAPPPLVNGGGDHSVTTNGFHGGDVSGGSISSSEDDRSSANRSNSSQPTNRVPSPSPSTASGSPSKAHENPDGSRIIPGVVVQPAYKPAPGATLRYTNCLQYIKTTVMKAMIKHPYYGPFKQPVDASKISVPSYFELITQPMDLGTIGKRLDHYYYPGYGQCLEDFRQMFINCFTYNLEGDDVYKMGKELEKVFMTKLAKMPAVEMDIPVQQKKFGKGGVKGKRGPGRPAGSGNKRPLLAASRVPQMPPVGRPHPGTVPHGAPIVPANPIHAIAAARAPQVHPVAPRPATQAAAAPQPAKPKKPAPVPQTIVVPRSQTNLNPPPQQQPSHSRGPQPAVPRHPAPVTPKSSQPAPVHFVATPFIPPTPPPVRQAAPVKKATAGRPPTPAPSGATIRDQLMFCQAIMKELMLEKHKEFAWPFYVPVDPVKLGIPDYPDVIKRPMDLDTVKRRLHSGGYRQPEDFAQDVRQIFHNCYRYNPEGDPVAEMAWKLQTVFEAKWAHLPGELPITRSVVRERQGLVVFPCPLAALAAAAVKSPTPPESRVRSPLPKPSTSKSDSGSNKRKDSSKTTKPEVHAMLKTITSLQEQIAASLEAQNEDRDLPKVKRQKKKASDHQPTPPAAFNEPSRHPTILSSLMKDDDKASTSAVSQKKKVGKRSLDERDEPSTSTAPPPPAKKPRKPRTPKAKPMEQPQPPALVAHHHQQQQQPNAQHPRAPIQPMQQQNGLVAGGPPLHRGAPVQMAPPAAQAPAPAHNPQVLNLNHPHPPPRAMTYEEKQHLSEIINDLKEAQLERVVQIIQRMEPQYADAPEEIEIDFETLQAHTLDALAQFIYGELGTPRVAQPPAAAAAVASPALFPTQPAPMMAAAVQQQLPPVVPVVPAPAAVLPAPQQKVKPKTERASPAKVKADHSKKSASSAAAASTSGYASSSGSSSDNSDSSSDDDDDSDDDHSSAVTSPKKTATPPSSAAVAPVVNQPIFGAAPKIQTSLFPPATGGAGLMGLAAEVKTFGSAVQRPAGGSGGGGLSSLPVVTGLAKLATGAPGGAAPGGGPFKSNWPGLGGKGAFGGGSGGQGAGLGGLQAAVAQAPAVQVPSGADDNFKRFQRQAQAKAEKDKKKEEEDARKREAEARRREGKRKQEADRARERDQEAELEQGYRSHFNAAGHHQSNHHHHHQHHNSQFGDFIHSPSTSSPSSSTPMSPGGADMASPSPQPASPAVSQVQIDRNAQREAERLKRQSLKGKIDMNRPRDEMVSFEQRY
ncbi:putative Bromodomain testis-specific protein [Hypsibius exemplaris]|uniref:Bromodomain testis-specific protein n=1 Tax=Hypsibius exemplaris TaxID=2072580 RepID=A0A1W0X5X1_HYPEX|nr:putative Bromodomain testis-specific protein [Hypsibius exemplaris]